MKQSFLDNETLVFVCLCLSVFRIYLEVIKFDFAKMPLARSFGNSMLSIHRYGFYMSIGYFLLVAPGYILS